MITKEKECPECHIIFETTNEKKKFCCKKCQEFFKAKKLKIDEYIPLETFLFMTKVKLKNILYYLKNKEHLYYQRMGQWFVSEKLFKVFDPKISIKKL